MNMIAKLNKPWAMFHTENCFFKKLNQANISGSV